MVLWERRPQVEALLEVTMWAPSGQKSRLPPDIPRCSGQHLPPQQRILPKMPKVLLVGNPAARCHHGLSLSRPALRGVAGILQGLSRDSGSHRRACPLGSAAPERSTAWGTAWGPRGSPRRGLTLNVDGRRWRRARVSATESESAASR